MILLWGSLAQQHTIKHIVINKNVHIPDGSIIRSMHPVKNRWKVSYSEYKNMFMLNYANLRLI